MYCLDTSIIVEFLRGNQKVINKIKGIIQKGKKIAITTLTLCELYRGVYLCSKSELEEVKLDSFISTVDILSLDIASSKLYGKYYYLLTKTGVKTQEIDLLIGCISIAVNSILVTDNIKHFQKIPNIKLEVW
tara:strand:- start:158 stop:553 length:396 start_codon:yes stop_codon:yes gene_type:complete